MSLPLSCTEESEMSITKDYLQSKLAEYQLAVEQSRTNMIANDGAAQAIQTLLDDLEKEERDAASS